MKKSIFVLGVAAFALAMVSCNKDEIKSVNNPTFEGDLAYVVVNINDVNNPSTRATDGGFQYGSETEYKVSKACFYFYGPDGDYVTEADVWDGGTAVEGTTAGNIEFNGYTVVTLKGLTSQEYPSWVVTVLNPGSSFKAPGTLAEFEGLLADPEAVGINGDSGNFTMATSSFVPNSDQTEAGYSSTYYFATPVTADNFSLDPVTGSNGSYQDGEGNDVTPIVIYVERLAAKVTLGVSATDNGSGLYPITVEEDIDGVTGPHTLYVKFNGWTLNGTAKYSNMVKTIDPTWSFGTSNWSGTGWNDAADYRSYWGASFNYGIIGNYPTTADPSATTGATDGDGTSYSAYLDYVSYKDCENEINTSSSTYYEYCAENTNTAGEPSDVVVISDKSSSAITNLLIAATVCDESGNALALVRCDGALYPKEEFLAYAASHIHLYYTEDGGSAYTQIDGSYLEIFNKYNGTVGVQIAEAYEDTTFYTVEGDVATEFTGITSEYCDEHFNSSYGSDAVAYTDGAMYYSIPIEHLNNGSVSGTGENADNTYPEEGNYGIVRNHIYVLTVTAVDNIGHGVYDPDEIIISQPEPETYAITAQVNILSWKLVEQSVTL